MPFPHNEELARVVAPFIKRLRNQRPRGISATTHPIQLDLTVVDVWSADVKTETFCAKLRICARWVCPPEHADEAMQDGGDALDTDWEPEWFPRITIGSASEQETEHAAFVASRDLDGICWITGEWRLKVRILEAYDLHAFPFDVQDFNIFVRIDNTQTNVELQAIPTALGSTPSTRRASVDAPVTRTWNTIAKEDSPVRIDASGLELPDFRTLQERDDGTNWLERPALYRKTASNEVHVVLLYERNPRFYVVNYMLLLFAITSCASFGWSVPWQQVEDRLSLDVTLLLTSVAFKQVLAGTVPPISYLTRIDAYALGSLAFLLLATTMHATIGFIIADCNVDGDCTFDPPKFSQQDAHRLDQIFLYVYLALWALANALYAISVRQRQWRFRMMYSLGRAKAKGYVPAFVAALNKEWYDDEDISSHIADGEVQLTQHGVPPKAELAQPELVSSLSQHGRSQAQSGQL